MALIELSAIERRFLLGDTTVNALAALNLKRPSPTRRAHCR